MNDSKQERSELTSLNFICELDWDAYLGPCQTSMINFFIEPVNVL